MNNPRQRQQEAREAFERGGELFVELSVPPVQLHPNARVGWKFKAGERSRYRKQAGPMAAAQVLEAIGHRPQLERAVVSLDYTLGYPKGGGVKAHDPDNLIAWAKAAIDSLQDAGILADDRHVVYLPPTQSRHGPGSIRPPILRIGVRIWDSQSCPMCGAAQDV